MYEAKLDGGRLKALRQARGLSALRLAQRAGVSERQIWRLEANERPNVAAILLARIAVALGTTVEYLVGLTDVPQIEELTDGSDPILAAQEIVAEIEAFDRECAEAEYTDTGDAWQILNRVKRLAQGLARQTAKAPIDDPVIALVADLIGQGLDDHQIAPALTSTIALERVGYLVGNEQLVGAIRTLLGKQQAGQAQRL